MLKKSLLLLAFAMPLIPAASDARVVRFVVEQRRPLAEGNALGSAGAYERLDGTAYFEVDPKDPLNAIIVNLDRAPKNGRGMVEFSAPFVILKPADLAKGNHKIFYAINNRGNQQAISYEGVARTEPVRARRILHPICRDEGAAYRRRRSEEIARGALRQP